MVNTENNEANNENRLVVNETSESSTSFCFNLIGFALSFLGLLLFMTTVIYFHVYLPNFEPSNCGIPYQTPHYHVVPMLLPSSKLDKEELLDKLEDYNTKDYIKFAGTSEYAYKYRLLFYTNDKLKSKIFRPNRRKNIVLFLPGNNGHFGQVRAIATETSRHSSRFSSIKINEIPDFYTIDFNEEYSGISGKNFNHQKQFIIDSMRTLVNLYNIEKYEYISDDEIFDFVTFENDLTENTNENTKIVIIAHSMSSVIVRNMLSEVGVGKNMGTLKNLKTVISLSSPVSLPVLTHDLSISTKYRKTNSFFKELTTATKFINGDKPKYQKEFNSFNQKLINDFSSNNNGTINENDLRNVDIETLNMLNLVNFISVTGGKRDYIVPERFTKLTKYHSLELSTNLDEVKRLGINSADHLSIVWCKRFLEYLSQGIMSTLQPEYLELSSMGRKKTDDSSSELKNSRKSIIQKSCFEISSFSANEECIEALENFYYSNLPNHEALLSVLTFNRLIGLNLDVEVDFVYVLNHYKSMMLTVSPSYFYLVCCLALLAKLRGLDGTFNPATHFEMILKSRLSTKLFGFIGLSLTLGYVESSMNMSDEMDFFTLTERVIFYITICGVGGFLSLILSFLSSLIEILTNFCPNSLKTIFNNSFSIVSLSVGCYVAFTFYNMAFLPLNVDISEAMVVISLLFIVLSTTTVLHLLESLIMSQSELEQTLSLSSLLIFFVMSSSFVNLNEYLKFSGRLEYMAIKLFPHLVERNQNYGTVKGLQGNINDIQVVQNEIYKVNLEALREEIYEIDYQTVMFLIFMTPVCFYFVFKKLNSDKFEIKAEFTKKIDAWQSVSMKKTKEEVKEVKKDSFIVEGEVKEIKKVLNCHLNEIIKNENEKIILLNDTKYVDSNVVETSKEERVQLDTIETKTKVKKNKNSILLFKEKKIKFRKIFLKKQHSQHLLKLIYLNYPTVVEAFMESIGIFLFFWGPTNTYFIILFTFIAFCALLLGMKIFINQLVVKKQYTKIEYGSY